MRNEKSKKTATAWLLATALVVGLPQLASAETVLRIGMTAADIPRTLGQPDQGFEGNRFTGLTMYDALTMWDLSSADKPSVMIPGLSTEWKVDEADKKKWTFKLRPGVTFHDGSPFNADAVVWNVEKVLKQDAPHFDASQVGVTASRMPTLASASKIDDMTVELTTKEPDSFLPINLTNLFMASPSKWQAFYERPKAPTPRPNRRPPGRRLPRKPRAPAPGRCRSSRRASGSNWSRTTPIGTRRACPRSTRWCCCRCRRPTPAPRHCCPVRSTGSRRRRLTRSRKSSSAASSSRPTKSRMSGRGSSPASKARPGTTSASARPPISASIAKACKDGLLAGLMVPATGTFEPGHPWRGKPTFEIKYDLKAAQKLMQEAGYGPSKKLTVKTQTSASGSGQMLPLPMNEYLQQALAECYFDVQLDVIEWNTLFTNWRRGAKDPTANGANATNVTYAAMDPFFALVRFLQSSMAPPVSNNWGFINNPKFDELVTKARQTFDPAARDAALAELHAASVDDAAFLYVAHDVAPRAMSPKVKGFVQPKSWFVDFSPVSMTP